MFCDSYPEFNHVHGHKNFYWTVEEVERSIPKLKVILEEACERHCKYASLQRKASKLGQFQILKKLWYSNQIAKVERQMDNDINLTEQLGFHDKAPCQIHDYMNMIAVFDCWFDQNNFYFLVYSHGDDCIKHYCTQNDLTDDLRLRGDGSVRPGYTMYNIASGNIPELPESWRSPVYY